MAAPVIIRLVGQDGIAAYHEWPAITPLPEGAVRVARLPGPFEDRRDGAWVTDHRAKADAAVPAAQIEEARAIKYLEALLITSPGGPSVTTGLLALEAKDKGIPLRKLAEQVLGKRAEFIRREVQRQRRQAGDERDYQIPAGDPLAKPS